MPTQAPLPGGAAAPLPAKPLRIAFVAWSFYPRVGGSVTTALTLSRALAARGIKVDIIAPLLAKDLPRAKELDPGPGIAMHWVVSSAAGSYYTFRGRLVFLIKMAAAVRRLSPLVSVFHAQDFNVGLLSALLGTSKPVAGYFGADPLLELLYYKRKHCPGDTELKNNPAAVLLRHLARLALLVLAGKRLTVITYNDYSDRAAGRYWRGPRAVIPVGIDTKESGGEKPPRENLLLYVGRLVCWKGFDDAVKFYKAAGQRDPALRMTCIGEGPLLEYYQEKYTGEGIEFTGGLPCGDVSKYYSRAKLLLAPSRYETFSITVSEAMAAGLPMAATGLEAYNDRLAGGENCLLVKDWGEKGREEIMALLGDPERLKRFSTAGRNSIKGQDISLVSARCEALYSSMAARQAGG